MGWWPWSKRAPADPAAVARDLEAARALLEQDDVEGARAALEDALERHGGDGRLALALLELVLRELDEPDLEAAAALHAEHKAALRALQGDDAARVCEAEAELAMDQGELDRALERVEAGLALAKDDAWLLAMRGHLRLQLARFADARADLERAYKALKEPDPGVLYDLACLAERDGKERTADELFARADSIDPDAFPRPARMSKKAFDRVVLEAIDELPEQVRALVDDGLVVQAVDLPPDDVVREQQDPLILGLYEGEHLGARRMVHEADDGALDARLRQSRVSLYKKNIEKYAADMDEVREQIRITLLHEVGHHLGFDEDGLDRIGLA